MTRDRSPHTITASGDIPREIEEAFSSRGPLERSFERYEQRPQQKAMAHAVYEALRHGEHHIIEAPTGIGKSFAYLVPAFFHAQTTHEKIVISTSTISLQEQLFHKDIPFLKQVFGDCNTVLVKGRSNYICLRRLYYVNAHKHTLLATRADYDELHRILAWAAHTVDGTLSDFEKEPSREIWEKVASEQALCKNRHCPLRDRCFFMRARTQMDEADLLIVNHHLFFSDLALRDENRALLPEYEAVVFDEARDLEDVATKHLGLEVSSGRIINFLETLFSPLKHKGLLAEYADREAQDITCEAKRHVTKFFKEVAEALGDNDTQRFSYVSLPSARAAQDALKRLSEALKRLKRSTRDEDVLRELTFNGARAMEFCERLAFFLEAPGEDYVCWVERAGKSIKLSCAPIELAGLLRERLFARIPAMVMTSATLSVDGTLSYFKKRLGLDAVKTLILDSVFDFQSRVTLYIAGGMPSPDDEVAYGSFIAEKILHYVSKSGGKALVLFTNYRLLRDVYARVNDAFREKGITVFAQGSGMPRFRMLKAFKKDLTSVLFGTDTFWTGIDVPGEALSNVIITKLPFDVPKHPVIEARLEKIKSRGQDPFLEYSVPEAVLKFKQGFGRLIRTQYDKGTVAVLDSRLINKSYGKSFLNSLPRCKIIVE